MLLVDGGLCVKCVSLVKYPMGEGGGKEMGGSLRETLPLRTSVEIGRIGTQILGSFGVHWEWAVSIISALQTASIAPTWGSPPGV